MSKQRSSIDGFIPRRSGNELGIDAFSTRTKDIYERKLLNITGENPQRELGSESMGQSVGRSDIDESLKDIDETAEPPKKLSRRQRRRIEKMSKKPRSKLRRIIKWFLIMLTVAILAVGGYAAYKFIVAGNNIFQGNFFGLFQNQPLKQDSNGRSNFLILGTTEDDPGHQGADLTDSMMIVSVDQKNKNIYMFSVPRDLYVDYGETCTSGNEGKINAYFTCSDPGTTDQAEQNRLIKTQKLIGDIFGIDIQYGVHANGTVIKEAVDAVGGIDVDVEGSNGDPGVLDRNFDWRCNFTCYLVKYTNGIHHLDGDHAWFLSMARGDIAPTYGLGNSNFDREKNQQKILIALKAKAMSTGTLTNLDAVTKLLDSFGNNLRTNIQTSEIRTLMQVSSDVKPADIHTISLYGDNGTTAVVKSGPYNGASVVMPSAGIFEYSDIQAYIQKNLSSNPVARESAPVVVLNGTGQSGYGQTQADILTKDGFNITSVDNAPDGTYGKVELYQIGNDSPGTATKLSEMYKVTIKKTKPPITVNGDVRFVIIFGAATT